MATNQYKLSICIITRNRSQNLERAIKSIKSQSIQPFEILVSDDSDEISEIEINKSICLTSNCLYLKGPRKGLYANRNYVAKNISGTHFRTMDDDHTIPVDHIQICMDAIQKEPNTIWTVGEFYPNDKPNKNDTPVAPGQLHPRGFSFTPKNLYDYYGISCGATIYPNKVLLENDINYEGFKFGPTYLEYGARLKNKGYIIKPLNGTHIVHHSIETFADINTSDELKEARIFSIILFSFKYKPSLKNKMLTVVQILFEIFTLRISLKNCGYGIRKAFSFK